MLALDGQSVRWYWCMFEFGCTIAWYTMHYRNCILACCWTTIAMIYDFALISIEYAMVPWWLWTNRRYVGKHWCIFKLECVITYLAYDALWNHHDCAHACYSTTMAMTSGSALMLIEYGTISCWLWTYRQYVGIGACLNLNMPLHGIRCNIDHHHNCTLACYLTTMVMSYGSGLMLIEYMERCHVGFGLTASTLV